jgi:hypothetical protein
MNPGYFSSRDGDIGFTTEQIQWMAYSSQSDVVVSTEQSMSTIISNTPTPMADYRSTGVLPDGHQTGWAAPASPQSSYTSGASPHDSRRNYTTLFRGNLRGPSSTARVRLPTKQACTHCREDKVKCTGGIPCERCERFGRYCVVTEPLLSGKLTRKCDQCLEHSRTACTVPMKSHSEGNVGLEKPPTCKQCSRHGEAECTWNRRDSQQAARQERKLVLPQREKRRYSSHRRTGAKETGLRQIETLTDLNASTDMKVS